MSQEDPLISDADRALADSFDNEGGDDSEGEDEGDDRQRLMRGTNTETQSQGQEATAAPTRPDTITGQATESPHFPSNRAGSGRVYGSSRGVNDGVFANLNAKPEVGEKEEQPPVSRHS